MDGGDTLLVQHMGLGTAVQPRDAGETGVVAQLVHVGGIHGVHGLVVLAAQLIGQHHPQLGGVVAAALVRGGVGNQPGINFHDPGLLGISAAAPAHEYVDIRRGHAMAVQEVQNDLLAHGHLVVGGGVLQQHRGIVEDALGVHIDFLLKVAHLGGGRTGVDDQQFGFHDDDLLLYVFRSYHSTNWPKREEKNDDTPSIRRFRIKNPFLGRREGTLCKKEFVSVKHGDSFVPTELV